MANFTKWILPDSGDKIETEWASCRGMKVLKCLVIFLMLVRRNERKMTLWCRMRLFFFFLFFNEWENCTPLKWHIESLPCARYLLKERGSFSQNWNQMISRDFAYHFDMSNSPLPSKFKGYFKAMYRDILIWFLFRDGSINKFI